MQEFQLITIIVSVSALIVSIYNLMLNLHRQWVMKQVDVRMEFQRRFDAILEDMSSMPEDASNERVDSIYLRYWELQLVQFNCWKEGLLRDDTYMYWMSRRFLESRTNRSIDGVTYMQGWEYAKTVLYDKNFMNFIDTVLSGEPGNAYETAKKLTAKERSFRLADYRKQFRATWDSVHCGLPASRPDGVAPDGGTAALVPDGGPSGVS